MTFILCMEIKHDLLSLNVAFLILCNPKNLDMTEAFIAELGVHLIRAKPERSSMGWNCSVAYPGGHREGSGPTPFWPALQTHGPGEGPSKASTQRGSAGTWKQQGSAARPNRWITYQRHTQQNRLRGYEARAAHRQLGHYQFTFN